MAESLGALIDEVAQVNQVGTTQTDAATTDTTAATTTDTSATTDTTAVNTTTTASTAADTTTTTSAEPELTEITDAPASTDTAATTTTTTAATDANANTTATKSFEEQLKELGFTSPDEAKAAKAELQQYKERNTLGTLLDKLTAQGVAPETVIAYHKLDLNAKNADGTPKVGDRAVLDLQMQLKYPTLTGEQRTAMLDKEYGSQNPDDDTFSIAGQGLQTVKAMEAREALMAEKAKVLDVKQASESFESVKQKEFVAAETVRVKDWESTPKVKEIISGLSKIGQKISFATFGADNKPVSKNFDFTHKIDPAVAGQIEETLRVAAIQNGYDPKDPKAFEDLKGMAENIYLIQNKDKVINDVVKQVSSYWNKYIATTYHGAKGGDMDRGGNKTPQSDARYEATIARL